MIRPRFLRPEHVPFASFEMVTVRLTDSAPLRPTICAWCPEFNPALHGVDVSHGMCQACSDLMIFNAMKRRREERERDDDDARAELGGSTCGANCGYCGRCS
jgi:hypothetical protein